ncbi:MAG: tetratricopeptide repeat protein, partial [Verrucomicrobia bacterium]|nr:tetratricopeptide repeat protein [Verrucomicrobiota bacterium]
VILLLLAVAVGAPIAAFKLNRERLRSQQVASFLKDMFTSFGPSALGQDTTVMRGILHTTAERVGRDLAGQPEVETELRDILGQTYRELALYKQMEEMARENLRFSQSHWGGEHLAVAAALQQLGEAMTLQGNHATAATYLRQALALERKLVGNEHPAVANTLETLALALKRQKQPHLVNEAEKMAREALAIQRKLFGNEHAYVANSLYNLGLVLRTAGKLAEAESAHKEALGLQRKLFGNESTAVAESLNSLAAVLHHEGKLAESEAVNREALAIYIKLFGKEHQFVANALGTLATTLVDQHKNAEAERMLKDVLTPAFASRPQSATFFRVRAGLFASQGRWIEASADASKVVQFEPAKQWGYQALTLLLVASGDLERYRHVCATNLDRFKSTKDADIAAQVARTCLILPSSGADLEAVDALAETAISMEEDNRFHHVFQFTKGLADYRQGRLSSAVEWMQKILIQTEPDALRDAKACAVLAMAQHQLHQLDEARNFLREARIAQSKWPNVENLDLRSNWRDWIMAQALVEEAGVLIEGPASRTNPFGTKSPQ